jgi:hypothetical protein
LSFCGWSSLRFVGESFSTRVSSIWHYVYLMEAWVWDCNASLL